MRAFTYGSCQIYEVYDVGGVYSVVTLYTVFELSQ